MSELYGRYHGQILDLARSSTTDGACRAKLREILAEFDDDCRLLPPLAGYVLRDELSTQIEHALLLFTSLMSAPAVTPFLPRERVRSTVRLSHRS